MGPTLDSELTPELMDSDSLSLAETIRALRDLERVNRWLLGLGASRRALLHLLAPGTRPVLLDLGTGSGQVTRALRRRAARRGVELEIIEVDRKLSHLVYGGAPNNVRCCVVADAAALPFRDCSVDWSFSNLLFHHFNAMTNLEIIREMRRTARRGVLIVDLRQSVVAHLLIHLLLPLLGVGRVAFHDGVVSTRQAWTLGTVVQLTSGMPVRELRRRFPFRFSLVIDPD